MKAHSGGGGYAEDDADRDDGDKDNENPELPFWSISRSFPSLKNRFATTPLVEPPFLAL